MSIYDRRGNPDEDLANYIKWWQEHKDEIPRDNLAKRAEFFETALNNIQYVLISMLAELQDRRPKETGRLYIPTNYLSKH
jgi:hypothetical protein